MADDTRKTKDRSPNFPFITLESALQRAQQFYAKEKRGAAPFKAAVDHWGYSALSSGGIQTVAALKSYGLLSDDGSGAQRTVRLTDLALRILLDQRPGSTDRAEYMREAAVNPPVAGDVYAKWDGDLPSEPTLHHYLVLERAFNEESARKAAKILFINHGFVGLDSSGIKVGRSELNEDIAMERASSNREAASEPFSFIPPMPATLAKQGEEIANIRVSKNCTIRLIASGPYSRQSIESLVAQLQLGLSLGNFDDGAPPLDSNQAS
jgi:hypothetical protein